MHVYNPRAGSEEHLESMSFQIMNIHFICQFFASFALQMTFKRDDFDFDIVNISFLDGDVPRRASYGVYISQLIRFARVCNHVTDFNARNKSLTAKLLQ